MPDQAYLGKQAALVPFFGEPALTNIVMSKLAAISGAAVLPFFFRRLPDAEGYRVDVGPPIPGFPSDDPVADFAGLFAQLEDYIRSRPSNIVDVQEVQRPARAVPGIYSKSARASARWSGGGEHRRQILA